MQRRVRQVFQEMDQQEPRPGGISTSIPRLAGSGVSEERPGNMAEGASESEEAMRMSPGMFNRNGKLLRLLKKELM